MWSMCDKPCNRGKISRSRLCNNPSPEFSGEKCHGISLQKSIGNERNCKGKLSVQL